MADLTVISRGRQPRLVVSSLSGINAQFAQLLQTNPAPLQAGSGYRKLLRSGFTILRRKHRWRKPVVGVMLGAFVATFLLGMSVSPGAEGQRVGAITVAQAEEGDCLADDFNIPILPGFLQGVIKKPINAVCRAFHAAAKLISEYVLNPIGNFLWSAFQANLCSSRTSIDPDDPQAGLSSLMVQGAEVLVGKNAESPAQTTWREYGVAGTSWGTYFLNCTDFSTQIQNYGANFVFSVSKVFSLIAILLFQETFNSKVVDYFFLPQGGAPKSAIDTIVNQLHFGLYMNMMAVAVVIGAAIILYRSIILRGGLGEALSKIGIMALVAGVALVYVSQGSQIIQKVSAFTDETGAAVLGALSAGGCNNSDDRAVPGGAKPYECAAQTMYHVLIYIPWANGEVGTIDVFGDAVYSQQRKDLAYRILHQQAYDRKESGIVNNPATDGAERSKQTQKLIQAKEDDRFKMVKDDWGARFIAKGGKPEEFAVTGEAAKRPYEDVDVDYPEYWLMFSGKEAGQRYIIAIMALLASFSLGLVLISVTFAYLALQLMTIVLAMVAPVAFLVGLVPTYGYRIFLKWFELGAGLYIKRLALVVFVGILLGGLQLIFKVPAPWWLHVVFAFCIGWFGLAYRHQLSSWASTGMEGMGKFAGIATGGLLGMKDGVKSVRYAKATWQGTRGLPARQRARAAVGSAYTANQTGASPAQYTGPRRGAQATGAGKPLSKRQQRKAQRRSSRNGSYTYQP